MKLQHVRAVARKEWWHLLRDPRSLALILLMPSMLLFLFGYALSLDITRLPLGVLQQSHDATANAIVARFDGSHAFDVVATYTDRRQVAADLQAGKVAAVLVIPRELTRDLANGDATMQLILDGVDANSARLARNYAQAIVHDPQLVFLDEPTSGLDPSGREQMLDLIARLGEIATLGRPLLVGASRKSFIGAVADSWVAAIMIRFS